MIVVTVDGLPEWPTSAPGEPPAGAITIEFISGVEPADWRWLTSSGEERRLPPFDILDADWSSVPALPGVDVRYAYTITGHPVAEVTIAVEVHHGRPQAVRSGGRELRNGMDVWFEFSAIREIENRLGRISVVEQLAPPACLDGDLDAAMLVAGLVDENWIAAQGLRREDALQLLELLNALEGRSLPQVTDG